MKLNLDTLKPEIEDYLDSRGLVIFHGAMRAPDETPAVFWDTGRFPDFKAFAAAAEKAGARIITLFSREFTPEMLEDAADRLEECETNIDERRDWEKKLREMRAYAGFTCALEMSFDHGSRNYIFDLRTEWYNEFCDMLEDIDAAFPDGDEDTGGFGSGYFSRN